MFSSGSFISPIIMGSILNSFSFVCRNGRCTSAACSCLCMVEFVKKTSLSRTGFHVFIFPSGVSQASFSSRTAFFV